MRELTYCNLIGFDMDFDIILRVEYQKYGITLTKEDVIKIASKFDIHIKMMEKQNNDMKGEIKSLTAENLSLQQKVFDGGRG
jgi:hypothetical protein